MQSKRDWLARLLPRKLPALEFLNNNVEFVRLRTKVFRATQVSPDRFDVHAKVADAVGRDNPVQYLEFGVFQGESILKWAADFNSHADSRFTGFDTFTGLHEEWTKQEPKGTFDVAGVHPQTDDPRVSFVTGLFQATLEDFISTRFERKAATVVHVDCDLYSSTLYVLASLSRLLVPGDMLIFDDFYSMNHEFRAFLDYFRAFDRKWSPVASTPSCNVVAIRLDT